MTAHAPGYDRIGALYRVLSTRWPAGELDDLHRDMLAAQIADCESTTAAALALFLQGDGAGASMLMQDNDPAVGVPIGAAFAAAGEVLLAVMGDDAGTLGPIAVTTLQTRSVEYAAAHELLIARHAASNTG